MTEKISLQIFWACMALCAGTVLSVIWVPFDPTGAEVPFRIQMIGTFFVVGLAAALVWVPHVMYRLLEKK